MNVSDSEKWINELTFDELRITLRRSIDDRNYERQRTTAALAEVERLTAERDFHTAQADALAAEWQRENDKLNACRAERDALAGQLAKVRQAYQVYRDSGAGIAGVTFFTFEEWLDYISDSENVPTW
jgi:hypothetical protein